MNYLHIYLIDSPVSTLPVPASAPGPPSLLPVPIDSVPIPLSIPHLSLLRISGSQHRFGLSESTRVAFTSTQATREPSLLSASTLIVDQNATAVDLRAVRLLVGRCNVDWVNYKELTLPFI